MIRRTDDSPLPAALVDRGIMDVRLRHRSAPISEAVIIVLLGLFIGALAAMILYYFVT
jgi:hypothetical protein